MFVGGIITNITLKSPFCIIVSKPHYGSHQNKKGQTLETVLVCANAFIIFIIIGIILSITDALIKNISES